MFVAVDGGAVKMPVSVATGIEHRLSDGVTRDGIGAEGTKANGRHPGAGTELTEGDLRRVNGKGIRGHRIYRAGSLTTAPKLANNARKNNGPA